MTDMKYFESLLNKDKVSFVKELNDLFEYYCKVSYDPNSNQVMVRNSENLSFMTALIERKLK